MALENQRAQGKPGARCTRSLVCSVLVAHECSHYRFTGTPSFPCAMVLTAYFVLSPVTGLCCHRRRADNSAKLDASVGASGPHDFTVRVSTIRQASRPRPPHPVPYVRDDRETPLCVGRDGGGYRSDLGQRRREIFLQTGLDRANQIEMLQQFGGIAH